ncbi:hypothetical protein VO63_17520 [Streptomyces showdoensis]|uniref:Uncharacterized protein n=1 Tax=Streptomyces showdoensis TaxID=68268 RepID=A0A2P2GM06_STREW|nr:hypothetical protein VO63_17520 [Streptomyces showdoensis]
MAVVARSRADAAAVTAKWTEAARSPRHARHAQPVTAPEQRSHPSGGGRRRWKRPDARVVEEYRDYGADLTGEVPPASKVVPFDEYVEALSKRSSSREAPHPAGVAAWEKREMRTEDRPGPLGGGRWARRGAG